MTHCLLEAEPPAFVVRSQGTEGRRGGDPAVEIPPSDAKYE